jgi:hypothetical protein
VPLKISSLISKLKNTHFLRCGLGGGWQGLKTAPEGNFSRDAPHNYYDVLNFTKFRRVTLLYGKKISRNTFKFLLSVMRKV